MSDQNGALREVVARARRRHELLMLDVVSVARLTSGALNTTTGLYAPSSAAIYSGDARIKREMSRDSEAAEGERQANRTVLVLPYAATGADDLLPGDVVTVSASQNADLVGATFTVVGSDTGTTASAYRYTIEDVS